MRVTDHRGRIFSELKKQQLIDRYGYPTIVVHRGELLHLVSEFAKSMTSGPEIVSGSRVVDIQFDPNDESVTVVLADGAQHKAGLVIGADGLHSIIREKIHGNALLLSNQLLYTIPSVKQCSPSLDPSLPPPPPPLP